jgi:hypothetical protein
MYKLILRPKKPKKHLGLYQLLMKGSCYSTRNRNDLIDKKEESPTQILRILTYLTLKMTLTIDIENGCIDKAKKGI